MTLEQTKAYVVGVLKGWFLNKKVLDNFSESETGKLLYKNAEISGSSSSEEEVDIQQAIVDTLTELNTQTPASGT